MLCFSLFQNMEDTLTDMISQLLIGYGKLAELQAQLKWVESGDPNGLTNHHKSLAYDVRAATKRLRMLENNTHLILTDDQVETLKAECINMHSHTKSTCELAIFREHMPPNFTFNEKALIIRTNKYIPPDVKIGLSFGWKFLFPFVTTNANFHSTLAQIESCVKETVNTIYYHELYFDIAHVLRERQHATLDSTVQWLRFLAYRVGDFLKSNRDIFASRSDKGAHTVVMNTDDYDAGIERMLCNDSYQQINSNPLMRMINTERKFVVLLKKNFRTKELSKGPFEPAVFTLAKFYGLLKIHKPDFCLRPITAMHNSPGAFLGKVFNQMITMCFPQSGFHLQDSYEAKRAVDSIRLAKNEVLVSFDVVSMYTNIPRDLAFNIVFSEWRVFYHKFGIGKSVLRGMLKFLLEDCTVFTAGGKTYKQLQGLPMGGSISTNLARLVMDAIVKYTLRLTDKISFIRVYVDDTIVVIKRGQHDHILNILNSFHPSIKFTCELENQHKSINFLNLTLIRDKSRVKTNWFRKLFASGRLVPFYSSHKRTTVVQTAIAFIHTVLALSDASFFLPNRPIVEDTLRINGFPETTIISLLNKHYTLMSTYVPKKRDPKARYHVFPHAICESRKIKRLLTKFKDDDVIYSDSTRNAKINFVTTRKTRTPIEKRGNLIVTSTCQCGIRRLAAMTAFNENGQMAVRRLATKLTVCNGRFHAFKNFKLTRGLSYRGQTRFLGGYLAWPLRKNVTRLGVSHPVSQFIPLIRQHFTGRQT